MFCDVSYFLTVGELYGRCLEALAYEIKAYEIYSVGLVARYLKSCTNENFPLDDKYNMCRNGTSQCELALVNYATYLVTIQHYFQTVSDV